MSRPTPATMKAGELAEVLGCSPFCVYDMVKRGTCPVPAIHLGRKIVFPRLAVERLLTGGGEPSPEVER